MRRFRNCIGLALLALGSSSLICAAGVPQGLSLAADEQIADEVSGETIARGNAELNVEKYRIRGTADAIEVRPKIDEVLFSGRAVVKVGRETYRSDKVSCTLDFARCAAVNADQPLPASALGAAEIKPR
jgi:hypothetical protein